MKLIVTGATGFVATEIIRQSLRIAEITSVIALARKPVTLPEKLEAGADASKLKSVVVDDYGVYSKEVKQEFAGASACIWFVQRCSMCGFRSSTHRAIGPSPSLHPSRISTSGTRSSMSAKTALSPG